MRSVLHWEGGMFNPEYTDEVLADLKRVFDEEGMILLQDVLQNPEDTLLSLKPIKEVFNPLHEVATSLSCNVDFSKFLSSFFQKEVIATSIARRFTWSNYKLLEEKESIAILDITPNFPDNAGGNIMLTNGEGDATLIPAGYNTLVIAKDVFASLQYCNHYAKDRYRSLIFIKYKNK